MRDAVTESPCPTDSEIGQAVSHADRCIEAYIARCRKNVPAFIERNFSLAQTWKLQRPTLWFDLLCAPGNSAWALPHLAIQKGTETLARVGYPGPACWARYVPAGIKTGYQRRIENLIRTDLLEWDREGTALPQGFLRELQAVPALRKLVETARPTRELRDLLQQFSSGRAIVSDVSATLLTLALSWWSFGSTSLGLQGVARRVAQREAHDRAASRFFLGKKLGSHFYSAFPPAVSQNKVYAILVFLVIGLSVAAMACTILSDPIRRMLGFHRNRLEVLVDEAERELIVLTHKAIAAARNNLERPP